MKVRRVPGPAQAKADFLNAIACGPPGRVPYFEFSFGRRQVERLIGPDEVRAGWPVGSIPAMRTPPQWAPRIARHLGIGFIACGFIWEIGRVYERGVDGNDVYAGGSIRSVEDLAAAPSPDRAVEQSMQRLEQFAALARQNDLAVGFIVYGPMAIAQFAMGLDHFCLALYDDRDLISRLIDAATDVYAPVIEHAAAKVQVDFLLISDALCAKSGPMFSPDLTRQLWLPAIEVYLRAARARRQPIPVGLHSDGDNSVFLDDYLRLGLSFLHPIEPCDGAFDIYQAQRKVRRGGMALAGNIDLGGVLARGTPAEVRQDVIEHIARLGPAGGYLCGSSHEISDDVPPENFQALVQAVHDESECSSWVQ